MKFLSRGKRMMEGEYVKRMLNHGELYYVLKMPDGKLKSVKMKNVIHDDPAQSVFWSARRVKRKVTKIMQEDRRAVRLVTKMETGHVVYEIYDWKGNIIFNQKGMK